MLEGLVANLLNRFLGIYVKNFDAKQLNIGIWSGDVKLRNLELRREALDQLRLPLNVVEGHLGQLTLSIPWSNLRGKPVKVEIEDVFLLAAPKEDADYDPEEEERRAYNLKMEKIESAEILRERNSEGMSQEEQRRNQSFTQSLITAVVDNLQISIKNVHFRYEDSLASPGHPFAVGLTLKELSAVSTDSEWNPTFIQSTSETTHKLATLGALSVYWNTDAELLGTGRGSDLGAEAQGISHAELIEKLRTGIESEENHQFMLRPVSGRAGLELDKSGKHDRPAVKTRLLFDELSFVLDDDQYRDALMLVDLFHYFLRHQEYKKLQPKCRPKEDPRAWFRFAGEAILSKIHDRNRRWSWDYIKERRDDRIAYINLFKKKKRDEQLTPQEAEEYENLQRKLSYEDIRFWRSLARNQLRKEKIGVKKPAPQQTWSEWIWGAKKEESEETAMTEEQRQELYNAIDWDEKKAIAESVDVPREWVKLQVNSGLRAGSFTLRRDPHGKGTEVMKLVFDNLRAKALQRPDSFFFEVDLGGLRVYDGTTEGSLFPQIVRVKDSLPELENSPPKTADDDELQPEDADDYTEDEDNLFHFQLEKNPLESDADSVVKVKMKSIEVIYNPTFIVEIVKFFEPPERHMESIGALLDSAGATVEELRQQTRAGLEFALEEHKKVDVQFDIHAPLIIVPESITQESSLCLILDAGHISVNSELVDRQTMKDLQAKQKRQYDENDYKELEHLLYDRFLLKLDSTQVLIGPGIEITKSQLSSEVTTKNLHIIDRINVDFVLEMCIVPKSTELTRTRISGHLPELHASMSDTKYKGLMKLIDIAIPQFDDGGREPDRLSAEKKPSESAAAGTRARSASFQPSIPIELPVVDEDSDTETDDEQTKKSLDRPTNIHRRDFEFKFTVGCLRGSLFRSDPSDQMRDHLLVELVAEGFGLDFYMRPFDMVAEIVLQSLSVDDYIEENPIPDFKRIISSKGFDADEDKDLFHLKFVRVKPESPEFQSTYVGIAMNLDMSISTINLVVTRKTLLTLLDFVLLTFTNPEQPNNQALPSDEAPENTDSVARNNEQTGKIRIKADLKSIALILNNDGVRLATLSLNTADVGIFLVGRAMLIQSRIGSLTLVDDVNTGAAEDSDLRRLLTIEGDNFADFKYETFDPESANYPGYDSEVYLRSGSIKINFLEEPYRKIINFLVKFGKMQAIFNAARQAAANQANQLQENASKMRFDVVVKTPILVFPGIVTADRPRDTITAHLGEIYAKNTFVPLDESVGSPAVNLISSGIRNIRLTSKFHYGDGVAEELEMIQKVNLDFSICYLEHQKNNPRPDMEIEGSMSPINLRVSQKQFKFLLELSKTIPEAFATDSEQQELEAIESLPSFVTEPSKEADSTAVQKTNEQDQTTQEPAATDENWARLDMIFKIESVGLELILAKDDEPVGNLEDSSLSKFALNDTRVKLRMLTDGSLESELLIHSLSIRDSRNKDTNKFRKIMSLINNDVQQQFMASLSMSPGPDKHVIAMLTIDSPRIILALDYLEALQSFLNSTFATEEPVEIEDIDEASEGSEPRSSTSESPDESAVVSSTGVSAGAGGQTTMSFRVNLVDAQVIMIANPAISHTEAIVLGTKQVLFAHQNVSTLQITKVGMFLCRMDKFETSRLRILDDFTLEMSMDSRPQDKGSSLTSIDVHIEPLVLRLSLRDILMAIQIVNKASEMRAQRTQEVEGGEAKKIPDGRRPSAKSTRRRSSAGHSSLAAASKSQRVTGDTGNTSERALALQRSVVLKREELNAQVDGLRVILIGDLHDLPLLDWSVKKFNVDVRDWSSTLNADTSFDTFINVYNFSKSAWEPLIEPWQLGFHVAKEVDPEFFSIDAYSNKNMELTVTSATIALASKSFQFLSTEEDVLSKPRGADAPYRIRNYTGFDLRVWADVSTGEEGSAAKLSDGEEYPWRFEDSTAVRETLAPEGHAGLVGVKLEGSGFESVNRIPVAREGEFLYSLKPKADGILHRLLVEVKLGTDNVKYITFRSPLLIENNTQIPVELGIFNRKEGHLLKIEKILPGDARPAPVGAAYMHSIVIRPDQGFGYEWSTEPLYWKELLRRPTRTIKCVSESGQQAPPFYFQMNATYNSKDSLTGVYPYMRVRIFAPVEIQNLLPYDFKYRIYDKDTRKDWTNFLRKGGVSPVHVVELSHLLLLSIDLEDTVFKQSDFAIINGNAQDFRREHTLSLKDERGIPLRLKLHYFNIPDSGGAFKVSIYSPYLILNMTGLPMEIQSKAFLQSARSAAGEGLRPDPRNGGRALPYMYAYQSEDPKNRSILKIGDSAWSKPQSFEALGSTFEVIFPDRQGKSEFHAGVSVAEGEGKYKMTKVVTIAPRFILKNKLGEDILVREPGSSNVLTIKGGDLVPLHFLRQVAEKQLCLCFPGVNNQWSSPFNIADLGTVHVKLAKANQRQRLAKVDVVLEGATLFIHFSMETRNWPFSMRNESDSEFIFYQANPNVEDDEDDRTSGWRPIRYRLPPRSIMPYAWDYPATKNKSLVLTCNGKERHIRLAEIGNLIPMRIPPARAGETQKIIDINIAADGPTQTLVLSNFKASRSLYKQQKVQTSQASLAAGFEVKELDSDVNFKAQLRLAGIGISLINKNLKELLYLTFREIEIKYRESRVYQTLNTTIKWIQIDNQLYGGIFPILLYPSVVPKTGKEMEAHPIFHAMVTRVKDDSYGVLYIKYATVLLQQMTLELDEDFIFAMLDFAKVPGASWSEEQEGRLCDEDLNIPEPQNESASQDVYFELLHLQPMQLDISFMRTERVNAEDTMQPSNPFMFFVNVMTMSMGNINDAPVRLNALMLENARVSFGVLLNNIQRHYTQEFLRQVHVILGSADFLGNPVGLFNNVSSGVAAIFYEPYQGLVMTDRPQELGYGIAKGATSFVKKSVFGFSDSMAKFTGSMSKGLAVATLDKEFQDQRRMSKSRNRPKHALYGITAGGNAFATSLASGIGGLARHPLQGAEKEGLQGFLKGVGKGVLGLATKPAIGAFDLASNLAEGVRNTTTVFDAEGLDRVRLTRFIATDGIVRPYSQREALGQFWLKTADDGKYFNEDYIAHLELPGRDMLVMLTYDRIMLVRTKRLRTEWDIRLTDIQTISKERTGMSITLKGGANGPFIPVQDESARNWLYRQIAIAVNAFNEKYNVRG
ncbi:membrane morphogenesis protein VPS13 [Aspergillus clavatus NRRL 1]|uniref:Vacuolar protein sorting-associated protein n=1 Tax=Aspergillus clavatus (strain ATCC 1007 / CBS 513.65 / DSM 816 / NCTC 3887 / NRRL 1 / QM 1276 / 107) TaxID=344612 RepID=A1CI87_ASPCL|nr:vacuolar protein sorting-associated protein vps13 [Aspergillus clavatus NRRL 1]EAW10592.1 vacuolar protein sorting-associated protein vps13 [Aspergillus clavatus NRRL 1]